MNGTVLITGCSSGLGAALVRRCLDDGKRVVATLHDLNRPGELLAMDGHPQLQILRMDVTEAGQVNDVVGRISEDASLHAVILNAGVHTTSPMESSDAASDRQMFEVNYFGALNCVQAVLPIFRQQACGKIIGISSLSAQIGLPGDGSYAASKAALERMLESLRVEVQPFGIEVSAVVPSSFPSGLIRQEIMSDVPSCYGSLMFALRQPRLRDSSGRVEDVVQAVMSVMDGANTEFRVPGDDVAAEVLGRIHRMSESERQAAVLNWSATEWWVSPDQGMQ
jgi:NAD(P)-dependent dehydrogenase (short-subunit alcohol dehydrogenase family)